MEKSKKPEISELEIIKQEVEYHTGIPNIKGKTRKKEFISAQAVFFSVARKKTKCSLYDVGDTVDRDHSTVIYGINNLEKHFESFPYLKRIHDTLMGSDLPIEYSDLHRELLETRSQLEATRLELKNTRYGNVKVYHKPLYKLIDKVPEYHVGTVKTRLAPILKMLEKPSRYNNYLNTRTNA